MARDELDAASHALRDAAAYHDGLGAERLSERADNLEALGAGDGAISSRSIAALFELRSFGDDVDDGAVREAIDRALEYRRSYRESA